jgi:hypothetical protein
MRFAQSRGNAFDDKALCDKARAHVMSCDCIFCEINLHAARVWCEGMQNSSFQRRLESSPPNSLSDEGLGPSLRWDDGILVFQCSHVDAI